MPVASLESDNLAHAKICGRLVTVATLAMAFKAWQHAHHSGPQSMAYTRWHAVGQELAGWA
eukprot:366569-Chlamydomonas_euryale.AAC.27